MRTRFTGRNPFTTREIEGGRIVEVWLGEPDHGDSERVLTVDRAWLPSLIATLCALER